MRILRIGFLLNKNDKKIRKKIKPQNLNLIDPVYKSNTQMVYTHKDARLDRFYISDFMVGQVLKTKVLPEIADHKMVIITETSPYKSNPRFAPNI